MVLRPLLARALRSNPARFPQPTDGPRNIRRMPPFALARRNAVHVQIRRDGGERLCTRHARSVHVLLNRGSPCDGFGLIGGSKTRAIDAELDATGFSGGAPRTADGKLIDPNTREPIEGKPDLGHKTGQEFRTEKAKAEGEGLSQQQFNNKMNDPNKYQLEDPSSNRSHKFEAPKSGQGAKPAPSGPTEAAPETGPTVTEEPSIPPEIEFPEIPFGENP